MVGIPKTRGRRRLLILTGTSAAGKSTIADALVRVSADFALTTAVTTRLERRDDRPGQYRYLSDESFRRLVHDNKLAVRAAYRSTSYGIAWSDLEIAATDDRTPIIVITPQSCSETLSSGVIGRHYSPTAVFIDAPDGVLDNRILTRDGFLPDGYLNTRSIDRSYARACDIVLVNTDLQDCLEAVISLWNT